MLILVLFWLIKSLFINIVVFYYISSIIIIHTYDNIIIIIDWDRGKQYVLWTRDCRCFPRQSRGSTKYTAFPRSQSISILLYTECQKRRKVPQINQTCIFNQTFKPFTWHGSARLCGFVIYRWIKSNVHRLATLPGRQ